MMEEKKRKRSEDDDGLAGDHAVQAKKPRQKVLFPPQTSHLDSAARALYIASQAAQDALEAIARGDADAIDAGLAPPGLSKSQRIKWRESLRGRALRNTKSLGRKNAKTESTKIDGSSAAPDSVASGNTSTKREREDTVAVLTRQEIIDLFFAGVASTLDDPVRKVFNASEEAKFVIDAILKGDENAITAAHAPPGLDKKQRQKWRQEQRLLAKRQQGCLQSNVSEMYSGAAATTTPTSQPRSTSIVGQSVPAMSAPLNSTTQPANVHTSAAGFTQLARPPTKIWNRPDESKPKSHDTAASSKKQSSNVGEDKVSTKIADDRQSFKEPFNKTVSVSAASMASGSSARDRSHVANTILHRVSSKESTSHVVPRRLPGNRNFDAPDYFADGSLADTQRRFEAWARAQRGGGSDSSDSESDEESDSESDDATSSKAVVRGSFHESFAEHIHAKPDELSAPATLETTRQGADESALESSDDEDAEDVEVQTQVSRELQEATGAPSDIESEDVQKSFPESEADAVHVLDSQTVDRPHAQADLSIVEPENEATGQAMIPSSFDDSKVRPPTPDQQAPGTPTPHGHPNTIRQANVRVKRILSQTNPGGDHSGRGPLEVTSKAASNPKPVSSARRTVGSTVRAGSLDRGELSDDVYEAIDDVTSGLMSTTSIGELPSMNECKTDPHDGDDGDQLTNSGSAIETSDLGRREDLMETNAQTVGGNVLESNGEDEIMAAGLKQEKKKNEQESATRPRRSHRRTISSSLSSALSELSHTPSLPAEPQVIIPVYVPETPEMKREDSAKKKRKMTGNSSKHFSASKRAKSSRKSEMLDEIAGLPTPDVKTPALQEEHSSVYHTAVSRMTRSAFKTPNLPVPEHIDTSQDEMSSPLPNAVQAQYDEADGPDRLSDMEEETPGQGADQSTAIDTTMETTASDEEEPAIKDSQANIITAEFHETLHLPSTPQTQPPSTRKKPPRTKSKSTGRISTHFITDRVDLPPTNPTSTPSKAGLSHAAIPPTSSPTFGLIQEKLHSDPFWLLIAVTFLNKTAGRSAVPIFWRLKEKYQTPEGLAGAEQEELLGMVHRLGLQNQRSRRLISIAKAWVAEPPVKGRRFRTLNYPSQGDGRARKVPNIVDSDAGDCAGALEIGHIPGCGAYAWDSWRIFCRDILRGVSTSYNSGHAGDVEPEWKRVLPLDKELRACLRWMWVKEGFIWDPLTGGKREATEEEVEKAARGEMEIWDGQEAEFARKAAVGEGTGRTPSKVVEGADAKSGQEEDAAISPLSSKDSGSSTIHLTPRHPPTRAAKAAPSIEGDEKEKPPVKPRLKARGGKKTPTTTSSKRKKNIPNPNEDGRDAEIKAEEDEAARVEVTPSKRKTRTSSFLPNDDEDYHEVEEEKEMEKSKRRRSKRISTADTE